MEAQSNAYVLAQSAPANLKTAIHITLSSGPTSGMRNSEIGRQLGIYTGHIGHEGHISRTLLEVMKAEGVVAQDPQTNRWRLALRIEE